MTEHRMVDGDGSGSAGEAHAVVEVPEGAQPAREPADEAIGLAAEHVAQGQHESAERELRRAIRIAPDRSDAHLQLGIVLLKRAVYPAAAVALRRAVELDPQSALAHLLLGETLNQLGEPSEAILALENVIRLEPSSKAFYALGIAYDRKGDPERAAEMYRHFRELNGR